MNELDQWKNKSMICYTRTQHIICLKFRCLKLLFLDEKFTVTIVFEFKNVQNWPKSMATAILVTMFFVTNIPKLSPRLIVSNIRSNYNIFCMPRYQMISNEKLIIFGFSNVKSKKSKIHWFIDLSPLPRGPHGKMNNTTND